MNLFEQYINNLNEKASIDWNNYLTPEEVSRFKSKDDKIEAAGEVIYDKDFKDRLEDFKKLGWTDEQLIDDLFSFDLNNHLNEGTHLFAFVKDEDGNDKIIEDSDYSDKLSFKRDLEANGYKVRRINDEADMYIMDNSDYRSINEVKSKIKQIEKDIKDGIVLPSEKIELENLKDLLNKVSLKESYTLKGMQDGKSFDISYSDKKEKLEKFKDEIQPKHKNIDMYIIEESSSELDRYINTILNSLSDVFDLDYYIKEESKTIRHLEKLRGKTKYTDSYIDMNKDFHRQVIDRLKEIKKPKTRKTNDFELWKKQIDSKSRKELYDYYNRLVSQMRTVNKSDRYNYLDLTKKINYIEDTYNIPNNFSHNLH